MHTAGLLRRNLTYYWRTNLSVVCGVATAVAVLAGALVVGDSVRASLRDLFLMRLGATEQVITADNFFREQLASGIQSAPGFADGGFGAACPLIVLEGTATHERSGRRGTGVQVYGVDERFWKFHGRDDDIAARPLESGEMFLSAGLAGELGAAAGDVVLLRVEKPSAIPVESLHGRKEDVGRTIRLTVREALASPSLGEFSLRPQQTAGRAVFVPLRLLQKDLEREGRVNAVLVSAGEGGAERQGVAAAAASRAELLQKLLREQFTLEDLGIKLRTLPERRSISVESESALVDEALAGAAAEAARKLNMRAAPVFSYLANSIRARGREIPYSLVAALDEGGLTALNAAGPSPAGESAARAPAGSTPAVPRTRTGPPEGDSSGDAAASLAPIILNGWAASELGAQTGDVVELEYYLWAEGGRLLTERTQLRLAGVVPVEGAAADRDLVPEYPGLTGAESLSDWDPPFPVDLSRVRQRDEDYWDRYRTTPKAFIPLARGQQLWGSRFGKLTSLRVLPPDNNTPLASALEAYRASLRDSLDPARSGMTVYAARAEGLEASRGATDFGQYFLYFSFFLVVSALLLTALFFRLGIEQRLREIGLLQSLGFPRARVRRIFLAEAFVLTLTGSLFGVLGAYAYGKLMMLGLSTWWVGATGTTALSLHTSPTPFLVGAAGGVLAALGCIVWTLRSVARRPTRSLLAGRALDDQASAGRRATGERKTFVARAASFLSTGRAALLFGLTGAGLLLAAALGWTGQVAGFFGGGMTLLVALLCAQAAWLRRRRGRSFLGGSGRGAVIRLGARNATHRPGRSILCITLIASAAFIIVAVDAFRRDDDETASDRKSGGGYPLLASSLLPIVHDPNTAAGREALNLTGAGAEADALLVSVTIAPFRLRPGDDASCLNLYRPREPRILAPTDEFRRSGRFAFQNSLAETREERANPWLLVDREYEDGAIPVIADANSMTYVLHLELGDDFRLERGAGGGAEPIRLRLVGALSDSIFQGELLMSERNFLRLFPEREGYRFFLLETQPPERASAVTGVLEERLSDFGFDVMPTAERLASFHRVENTYLSTFQMLGGLGLILGTAGLAAVLLRNVIERRRELALLRAVGYNRTHFALMVIAENALLLCCGLATGTICALIAIAPALLSRGGRVPLVSLGGLLLAVLVSGMAASLVATIAALRSPLLPALRAE